MARACRTWRGSPAAVQSPVNSPKRRPQGQIPARGPAESPAWHRCPQHEAVRAAAGSTRGCYVLGRAPHCFKAFVCLIHLRGVRGAAQATRQNGKWGSTQEVIVMESIEVHRPLKSADMRVFQSRHGHRSCARRPWCLWESCMNTMPITAEHCLLFSRYILTKKSVLDCFALF